MPRRARPHSFRPRRRREQQSVPASSPTPPMNDGSPPLRKESYADVSVADFVDVPSNRFAALNEPRQHKLVLPPSYDLFSATRRERPRASPPPVVSDPCYFGALPFAQRAESSMCSRSHSSCSSHSSLDSNVYVIQNSHHVANLLSIVAPAKRAQQHRQQHPQQQHHHPKQPQLQPSSRTWSQPISAPLTSFRVVKQSAPSSVHPLRSDDTDLYEGHLEHLRFQDATSEEPTSGSVEVASEVCSTSVTNLEPVFYPSVPHPQSRQHTVSPYNDAPTESNCSLSSQCSAHTTSVTDACTIRSVESNEGIFRTLSRTRSPLITRIDSSQHAHDALHANRNLMCQNPASPTKYTFKPTYQHSSPQVSSSGISLHQPVPVFRAQRRTSPIHPQLPKQQVCHKKSYSFSSLSSQASSEPLTLAAIKKAVDIIDPRVVFSVAQSQSLAFAAAGLFRKKRDSEETFNSSSTEYYEDEYTRFLEKKHCLSPSRLIQHPYISRMINYDGWSLRSSKVELESNSSLSVATCDEDYFPAS